MKKIMISMCMVVTSMSFAETRRLTPQSSKPSQPAQRGPTLQSIFVSIMDRAMQNGFQLKTQIDTAALIGASAMLAGVRWVNNDKVTLKSEYYDLFKPVTQSGLVVCNAQYQNASYPGYVINNKCSIAAGGREVFVPRYNLLTNPYNASLDWIPYTNAIPALSIEGGVLGARGARRLLICSAKPSGINGVRSLVGSYDQGICHLSWQGKEFKESTFSILAVRDGGIMQVSPQSSATSGPIQGPGFQGVGPAVNPATGKPY